MGFLELIKKVQYYSGFSDTESKTALELMVESLAVHLGERDRLNFANLLPLELHDIALSVCATEENCRQDIIAQFMEIEGIDKSQAKKQIYASWTALKDTINDVQIGWIKAQMPSSALASLR